MGNLKEKKKKKNPRGSSQGSDLLKSASAMAAAEKAGLMIFFVR